MYPASSDERNSGVCQIAITHCLVLAPGAGRDWARPDDPLRGAGGVTGRNGVGAPRAPVVAGRGAVPGVGPRRAVRVAPVDGTAQGARRAVVAGAVAPRDGPRPGSV